MVDDHAGREAGHGDDEVVEKFRPTSGPLVGYVALVLAAGTVAVAVIGRDEGVPSTLGWIGGLVAVLVWSSMLRPRLWVTRSDLVMRNMLDTVAVPLAAIEQIAVRQVLAVRVGEKRYVCPAVGKSWRQNLKAGRARPTEAMPGVNPPAETVPPVQPGEATTSYADFVEARLHHLAEEARAKAGIALMSDEQLALADGVRRHWAWPEIVALAATAVGAAVSVPL